MSRKSQAAVGVGLIGCGGIARGMHLPQLKDTPQLRLVGCADLDLKRARDLACRGGAEFATCDHHELLARDDVEAVIVCTPHPAHANPGIDSLRAGKHLLIQKPMTTNIKDARRLLKAARRSDRVALALPYLFDPWLVAIERLLRRGVVGEVRMVRCRIAHGIDHPSTSWFAQKKKAQGGALFDLGVYAVALLVDLFGPVRTVSGLFGKPTAGVTVEQNALLSLGFASGLIGTVETSWQEPAAQAYLSIYGRKATLDCSGGRIRLLSGPRKAWTPVRSKEIPFAKKLQMPTNVCRHWADCIQKGTRPLIPIERGLHLMEVLCAGYTSVAEGGIVRVRSTP